MCSGSIPSYIAWRGVRHGSFVRAGDCLKMSVGKGEDVRVRAMDASSGVGRAVHLIRCGGRGGGAALWPE
eukprot:scaffold42929_cov69-Phaeocystis_antarctica.AAC.9